MFCVLLCACCSLCLCGVPALVCGMCVSVTVSVCVSKSVSVAVLVNMHVLSVNTYMSHFYVSVCVHVGVTHGVV